MASGHCSCHSALEMYLLTTCLLRRVCYYYLYYTYLFIIIILTNLLNCLFRNVCYYYYCCDLPDVINCQPREFAVAPSGPVHSSSGQQSGIHSLSDHLRDPAVDSEQFRRGFKDLFAGHSKRKLIRCVYVIAL